MKKKLASITESEWKVMKILWNKSPLSLNEIIAELSFTNWSSTTIQTYLFRLTKKSLVVTQRIGRGYLYSPYSNENECQVSESKNFLNRVYEGSLSQMVFRFVESQSLSNEELAELKKLIAESEKKNENSK